MLIRICVCVALLFVIGLPSAVLCSEDDPPLFAAVDKRNVGEVRRLIAAGENVNAQDLDGDTPLHYALGRGYTEIIQVLIEAGADTSIPNNEGSTVLLVAVMDRDTALVSMLIEAGADANQRLDGDYWGIVQPLHWATYSGNTEMTALLLFYGADPNLTVRANKITPLTRVVLGAGLPTPDAPSGDDVDHVGTARILLAAGAEICANNGAKRAEHLKYLAYVQETFAKDTSALINVFEIHRCISKTSE